MYHIGCLHEILNACHTEVSPYVRKTIGLSFHWLVLGTVSLAESLLKQMWRNMVFRRQYLLNGNAPSLRNQQCCENERYSLPHAKEDKHAVLHVAHHHQEYLHCS